jgi:apolipoprotein N-acyltransferase
MQWEKVITDPLGIAGFALSLVFTLATRMISQKRKEQNRWLAPAAYALAAVCVIGGFALPPSPAITTGNIEQNGNGNVAGVQGNVNINTQSKKPRAKKAGQPQ